MKPSRTLRIATIAALPVLALGSAALFRWRTMVREAREAEAERTFATPDPPYPPARCPSFAFPGSAEPPLPPDTPYYRPPRCEPQALKLALRPQASPLWKRLAEGCDKGSAGDCFELGRLLLDGRGGVEDARMGLSLLHTTCEKGHARACSAAGRAYAWGVGAPFSGECGEILLQRGCDGGDAAGCVRLGRSLLHAWSGHFDPARGSALLAKHCPTPTTCPDEDVSSFEHPLDAERCAEGDYFACENASIKAPKEAFFSLVRRSCEAGSPRGCWLVSRALATNAEARAVLEEACKQGELHACFELLHPERQPRNPDEPVPRSPLSDAAYAALREAACRQGSAGECYELARACAPSSPEALRLDEAACPAVRRRTDGFDIDGRACRALGDRYRRGDGVPRDAVRAEAYYRAGCFVSSKQSPRDELSCLSLAEMYEQGDGVPRDQARALDLYAGLCSIGSEQCRRYRRR
jgi:uncharacterized protein